MDKDPKVFLKHILESIDLAQNNVKDINFEQFSENISTQDAVVRRLEIIGEAVKNLPDKLKDIYPEIPWIKIVGMRNKLIHEYFGVDVDLVWSIVKDYLPPFKKQIQQILAK